MVMDTPISIEMMRLVAEVLGRWEEIDLCCSNAVMVFRNDNKETSKTSRRELEQRKAFYQRIQTTQHTRPPVHMHIPVDISSSKMVPAREMLVGRLECAIQRNGVKAPRLGMSDFLADALLLDMLENWYFSF